MPFMLGSFTNGLFGSLKDTVGIMGDWEKLKQSKLETKRQQDLIDAAKAIREASAVTPAAGGGVSPQVTNAQPTPTPSDYGAAGEYGVGQRDSVVAPDDLSAWSPSKMASPDNPSEGKARLASALPNVSAPAVRANETPNFSAYPGGALVDRAIDLGTSGATLAGSALDLLSTSKPGATDTPGAQIKRAWNWVTTPPAPSAAAGTGGGRRPTPYTTKPAALLPPGTDVFRAAPDIYQAPTVVPPEATPAPPAGYPGQRTMTPAARTGSPRADAGGLGAQILAALNPNGYSA